MAVEGLPPNWGIWNGLPDHPALLGAVVLGLGLLGVPMSPLWGLLGFRLGLVAGLLVAWPSAVIAAAIQFGLMRLLGSKLRGWRGMLHRDKVPGRILWQLRADATGLVLARLTWALPFVAVNAWAAASNMAAGLFLGITALAIVPNILGLVILGAAVRQMREASSSPTEQAWWAALGLLGSLSGVALMAWYSAKWVRWPSQPSDRPE